MSNFGKKVPSKRKTKIVEEAIANAPSTAKNLAVYVYDFSKREYALLNPLQLKPSSSFPSKKLQLVCRDIRTNVKEFPRPRFQKIYLCKSNQFLSFRCRFSTLIQRYYNRLGSGISCAVDYFLCYQYC